MRLNPRVKSDILAQVCTKLMKSEARVADISIGGVFLKGNFSAISGSLGKENVLIKFDLPKIGPVEYTGKIIRKNNAGMVVNFHELDTPAKLKLWKYVVESLKEKLYECPYCGEKFDTALSVCTSCNWKLDFNAPDYFAYHEKTHLQKKLYYMAETLEADQIRKLINFTEIDILKKVGSEKFQEFVGSSSVMSEVFNKIRKIAPTDIQVLILGESGTGKELTALAIHERSQRKNKPLLTINCAAIPEGLLETELFGYEKGAFTGAYTSKKGKFELADNGTLFLDEIGDLPLSLQSKLLRFLENKIIERVGGTNVRKVDVRLIAATNCDLKKAIEDGKFRNDLYYRLDVFNISLPPVRDRGEDCVILAKYFLSSFSRETGIPKSFTDSALTAIKSYHWPGNVREIINKVRRAIVIANDDHIKPSDLELNCDCKEKDVSLRGIREQIEKDQVKDVLNTCNNNMSKAAKMLGISRPTLYTLKKRYDI